jgi:hypothetical protein
MNTWKWGFLSMVRTKHLLPLLSTLTLLACEGTLTISDNSDSPNGHLYPKKELLKTPDSESKAAAGEFIQNNPFSEVFFSQNSGHILLILAQGGSLFPGDFSDTEQDAEEAFETLLQFFETYPNLFRIESPRHELEIAKSLIEYEAHFKTHPITKTRSLRIEQNYRGFTLRPNSATAFFTADGDLLGIQTQLTPTQKVREFFEENEISFDSIKPAMNSYQKPLDFQKALTQAPFDFNWKKHIAPMVSFRLDLSRYQIILDGPKTLWQRKDPFSNEVIDEDEEFPSAEHGSIVRVNAPNSQDQVIPILSTQGSQHLEMKFSHLRFHSPQSRSEVRDANFSTQIQNIPLQTKAASWSDDPDFSSFIAATGLMENMEKTLNWFSENLNYQSWDGKGGSLIGAIRYNLNNSDSTLNAYGGNGFIMIGDEWTEAGFPLSEGLDIVAHEFAHSVISAHSRLRYQGESGAISEALSDVFGKSVEGFLSTTMGDAISFSTHRDLLYPGKHKRPSSYGEYRLLPPEVNRGGVHFNSTVLSHPLAMTLLQGGYEIEVPYLMLHTLKASVLNPFLSLEDFAATTLLVCSLFAQSNRDSFILPAFCSHLEKRYGQTELLNLSTSLRNEGRSGKI